MKNTKVKILVEGAIMVALAFVLSCIKVFNLPWGGSITLMSMLPIVVFSVKHGVKKGLFVAFVYSLLQFGQGVVVDGLFGWGLTPAMLVSCIMFDYILAYTVIGFAGMFRAKDISGCIAGTVIAIVIRFAIHVTSGVVIWHSSGKIWEAFSTDNELLYSFLYNGTYMLPELVFTLIGTIILFTVPQTKKLITSKGQYA